MVAGVLPGRLVHRGVSLQKTGRRLVVRVVEPSLSPHSECWQRDVRCPGCTNQKTKKPVDVEAACLSARLRWMSGPVYPGRAAHQIGTHCAHRNHMAELVAMQ